MHTVELLAHALNLATRLGFELREEWLGGNGGGACELRGRKILFLDLALSPDDQLQQVLDVLRLEPQAAETPMPHQLRDLLRLRRSA